MGSNRQKMKEVTNVQVGALSQRIVISRYLSIKGWTGRYTMLVKILIGENRSQRVVIIREKWLRLVKVDMITA